MPKPPQEGSEAQRQGILQALGDAMGGTPTALLVEGEAGIGRSTLLAEMAKHAENVGFSVAHTRLPPAESQSAHSAVRRLLGCLSPPGSAPDHREFERALAVASEGAPVLLVLDDLHWCDGPSLDRLGRVADRGRTPQVTLLASVRTGEAVAAPAPFADLADRCRRTALVGLAPATVERLVRSALSEGCDPVFLRAVVRETGGNPRLLWSLLDELIGRGAAPDEETGRHLARYAPESAAEDAYARMRGFGRSAVSMAQAVAVLGEHAELAIAGRLAGLTDAEATSAVDRLVRRQLLVNQQPLAFRRPLIAAAIERFLPVSTADKLHSRAARVLHEAGAEKAEVAEHLVHTSPGIDAWAGEILHDAGVDAMAAGRPRAGERYLRRALREPRPWAPRSCPAVDPAGFSPEDAACVDIASHLAGALLMFGRAQEARTVLDRTALRLSRVEPLALRLEAQAMVTALVDMEPAVEMNRRATGLSGREGQDTIARLCLDTVRAVQCCRHGGSADEARALALGVLTGPAPGHFLDRILYWANVITLSRVEDDDSALHYCDLGALQADSEGDQLGSAIAYAVRCRLLYRVGRLGEALEAARSSTILLKRSGVDVRMFPWLQEQSLLAHVLVELGETAEAGRLLGVAASPGQPGGPRPPGELGSGRGQLLLARGDARGAMTEFLDYGALLLSHNIRGVSYGSWRSWSTRAFAALGDQEKGKGKGNGHQGEGESEGEREGGGEGERERARRLAEAELALARRWGRPKAVGTALHACALVAGAEDGPRLFEEAEAALSGPHARLPLARVLADHGTALRRLGRDREAVPLLRRAAELAAACDAVPLAEHARAEARRAAAGAEGPTRAPAPVPVPGPVPGPVPTRIPTPKTASPSEPSTAAAAAAGAVPPVPQLEIRCFGVFQVLRGGQKLDCSALRPKVRALFQLLAIHTPRLVHRERLLDALWPDLRPEAGIRNLQVAISQLRGFLEPEAGRGDHRLLLRDGESYRIALSPGDECDVREFEHAVADWRRIRGSGRTEEIADTLRAAHLWYAGSLLPEVGPAEWVVPERQRLRIRAADVAGALAEAELALGRPAEASEAARRSLELDRYRDRSWQLLVAAHREAGSTAAAERAQREYERVIRTLD
ncbi:BTAD domain-containing putative transcriptional regulator [Streptomyces graminilatus]|uniref:BTAD domain-containing putative transcriptional regulator n=1 Tax=Streptomyces graminilatus TaxID=1464070 RepID=UPI0018E3D5B0|nr:BTAD domain-containing putative transcriptional regulator [Streptomyces graminilatus]